MTERTKSHSNSKTIEIRKISLENCKKCSNITKRKPSYKNAITVNLQNRKGIYHEVLKKMEKKKNKHKLADKENGI